VKNGCFYPIIKDDEQALKVGLFALTIFARFSQKGVQTIATIPNAEPQCKIKK